MIDGEPMKTRRRRFASVFLLWWLAFSAWSFATPSWGAPDEFAHAYRAYALARGEVYVKPEPAAYGTGGWVKVPKGWVQPAVNYRCFIHKPETLPRCIGPITNDDRPVRVASTAARYNPVYYAFIGIGSLGTSPTHAIYAMRVISAALSAFFLALATTGTLRARRPWIATSALILACTPMVGFLAGSINPNGLEIAAALSAWVNGYLFLTSDSSKRRHFAWPTAISLIGLAVPRGLSPLWVVVVVLVLAVAALREEHIDWAWAHARSWVLGVCGAVLAALMWTAVAKSLTLNVNALSVNYSYWRCLQAVWDGGHRVSEFVFGTIGTFGWQDGYVPHYLQVPWLIAAVVCVVLALIRQNMRTRIALVALTLIVVFVPMLIEAKNYNTSGLVWQARYSMPVSLGIVLLAGLALAQSTKWKPKDREQWWIAIVACAVAMLTDITGFLYAFGRNTVGGMHIALSGKWDPPVPGILLVLVQVAAFLLLSWIAVSRRSLEYPEPEPESA